MSNRNKYRDGCALNWAKDKADQYREEEAREEAIQIIVLPDDGLCEGCGDTLGDDPRETDDMMVLCRECYDLCPAEESDW